MRTLLKVIVRAIGYGFIGGLHGTPCGVLLSFLVGFLMGRPEGTLGEGALFGATLGAAVGVAISDPTEEWCAWLDSLFEKGQVREAGLVLAPKSAKSTPEPLAAQQASAPAVKPVVLFLCTGNSARSQMAEAFLKKYAGDRFEVHSAGLKPKGIHPLTVNVMREVGIDISGQQSKGLRQFLGSLAVRFAIIVCRSVEPSCPAQWPGALARLEWPFDDPAAGEEAEENRLHKFREVRDQIEEKVKHWLEEVSMAC
jgi:arsenate reductase